ncbi:hypothetical protein EVAR_94797_1 [Eumeta japonica]|uniref:Uncharacterized protein n=1 Tax=Eumeta variegata TaxID=151549 RepID=A0A4C1UHI9_EUMVA|nr:hypothetical protein EVAR_94797_1 [Eumeta japonica]
MNTPAVTFITLIRGEHASIEISRFVRLARTESATRLVALACAATLPALLVRPATRGRTARGKNVLNQKSELQRALLKHKEKQILNQEKEHKETPEYVHQIGIGTEYPKNFFFSSLFPSSIGTSRLLPSLQRFDVQFVFVA